MTQVPTNLPGVNSPPPLVVGPGSAGGSGALAELAKSVIGLSSQIQANDERRRREEDVRRANLQSRFRAQQRSDLAETEEVRKRREAEQKAMEAAGRSAVNDARQAFQDRASVAVSAIDRSELQSIDPTNIGDIASVAAGMFSDELSRIGEPESPEYVAALDEITKIVSTEVSRGQQADRKQTQAELLDVIGNVAIGSGPEAALNAARTLGIPESLARPKIEANLASLARAAAVNGDVPEVRRLAELSGLDPGRAAELVSQAETAKRQADSMALQNAYNRALSLVIQGDLGGALSEIGSDPLYRSDDGSLSPKAIIDMSKLVDRYNQRQEAVSTENERRAASEAAKTMAGFVVSDAFSVGAGPVDPAAIIGSDGVAVVGNTIAVESPSGEVYQFETDKAIAESLNETANLMLVAARDSGEDLAPVLSQIVHASINLGQPLPDAVTRIFSGVAERFMQSGQADQVAIEAVGAYRAIEQTAGGSRVSSIPMRDREFLRFASVAMDSGVDSEQEAMRAAVRAINRTGPPPPPLDRDALLSHPALTSDGPGLLRRGFSIVSALATGGEFLGINQGIPSTARSANSQVFDGMIWRLHEYYGALDIRQDSESLTRTVLREFDKMTFQTSRGTLIHRNAIPGSVSGSRSATNEWVTHSIAGIYEQQVVEQIRRFSGDPEFDKALSRIDSVSATASVGERLRVVESEARRLDRLSRKSDVFRSPFLNRDGKFVATEHVGLMSDMLGNGLFLIDLRTGETLTGNVFESPADMAERARRAFDETVRRNQ